MGIHHSPHTHPIPTSIGIPMGISTPTAGLGRDADFPFSVDASCKLGATASSIPNASNVSPRLIRDTCQPAITAA